MFVRMVCVHVWYVWMYVYMYVCMYVCMTSCALSKVYFSFAHNIARECIPADYPTDPRQDSDPIHTFQTSGPASCRIHPPCYLDTWKAIYQHVILCINSMKRNSYIHADIKTNSI